MTHPDPSSPVAAIEPGRIQKTARLSDVGVAPENMRFGEPPDADIPTLAATLKAAGVLMPLTARPGRGRKEKPVMALDGRRRLLALNILLEAGEIQADYPIAYFEETDPARQAAAALLTNTAAPVHVADVIGAIGKMLKAKLDTAAIAAALGYAEVDVRRLAALAGLPKPAIDALRAGMMNLRQAKLLARLTDRKAQLEIIELASAGHGFQDWRITERLETGRVTPRDRRFALVGPERYATAGGRTETDLFGEMADRLLDPDILTTLWIERASQVAALLESEGLTVTLCAEGEPELAADLEALGWHDDRLDEAGLTAWRAARAVHSQADQRLRERGVLYNEAPAALAEVIRLKIEADQAGAPGRLVTAVALWPSNATGAETRCYAPFEPDPEGEADGAENPEMDVPLSAGAPTFPAPDLSGIGHALHEVRTDVATRGLIRALADDPGAALSVLIARLFSTLVLRRGRARGDAVLTLAAEPYGRPKGRVIEALDGAVRERLADRRAAWEASETTVLAWVVLLPLGEKMSLLAELTALSLDLREERTSVIRRSARAEAAEIAELCQADIAVHWTPDAPFLAAHSKPLLLGMLETMGADTDQARALKKTELVDWVAEQAAERGWAPSVLSWSAPKPEQGAVDADPAAGKAEDEALSVPERLPAAA